MRVFVEIFQLNVASGRNNWYSLFLSTADKIVDKPLIKLRKTIKREMLLVCKLECFRIRPIGEEENDRCTYYTGKRNFLCLSKYLN